MSVLTNNSSSSSSPTTTLFGKLVFRDYDPGRYICCIDTQGVHFDSGKAVLERFLNTLASVVGSIEEAKKRIYFVSCESHCFYFGASIDKLTSEKLRDLSSVNNVAADHYFDIRNKSSVAETSTKFSPLNWDHRLVDMSRYYESSNRNMEEHQDPGHWLIKIREPVGGFSSTKEVVDSCIDLLAAVVGRKEAIKKIYAVWSTKPYGFGAEIDMGTLQKLKELPNLEFLPDHAFDVKKDFGILVVGHVDGPNSSVACTYWPLDDTYGSNENISESDEEDLYSDVDDLDQKVS